MLRTFARAAFPFAAALAFLGVTPVDDTTLTRLVSSSASRTAALKAYTFHLNVDIGLRTFPYVRFVLDGAGNYARPNRYTVQFKHVPWFAKGFENVSLDALDPSSWPAHYTIEQIVHENGRYIVDMKDKIKSPLAGVHAEVDDSGLRRIVWKYSYGGRIEVDITPKLVDGFPLPDREDAEVKMPGYHVIAHARFENYKVDAEASPGPAASAEPSAAP